MSQVGNFRLIYIPVSYTHLWFSGFYQRIGFSDVVVYASLYFNRMLVEHGILALYIGIDNLYGQE